MRTSFRLFACCALCLLTGVLNVVSGQTVGTSRHRIPASSAEGAIDPLLVSAQAAMDRKDYQAAIQNYLDYLAKKPEDALAHFQLGYAYSATQRSESAKAEYEKAISLDPKLAAAYLNLGLTLLDTDPGAAVQPLQKAVEFSPEEAQPRLLLGMALERSGKLPPAIEQYQIAEKLDSQNFDIRVALGRALLKTDNPSAAELEFRTGLTIRSDSPSAQLGLAQSLL